MISKKTLKTVRRQRLIEAVALLNNADYIHTQINLLLNYSEAVLTTGKDLLSLCLVSMGKWGEEHKGKAGFPGKLADWLAPLKETGEKLDVKSVDLLRGILSRYEDEKARLQSLSDEGLADMFLHAAARIVKFGGDVSGGELDEQVLLALTSLYSVQAPGEQHDTLEDEVAERFLRELLSAVRSKIKQTKFKHDEAARERYQSRLDSLTESEIASIQKAYGVDVPTFDAMKTAVTTEGLELSAIRAKGFGLYLGMALLLDAYAFSSKTLFPLARGIHLVTILTLALIPLLGFVISASLFGIFEWRENERFDRRMLAYLAVPFYLETVPHSSRSAKKPKPKAAAPAVEADK